MNHCAMIGHYAGQYNVGQDVPAIRWHAAGWSVSSVLRKMIKLASASIYSALLSKLMLVTRFNLVSRSYMIWATTNAGWIYPCSSIHYSKLARLRCGLKSRPGALDSISPLWRTVAAPKLLQYGGLGRAAQRYGARHKSVQYDDHNRHKRPKENTSRRQSTRRFPFIRHCLLFWWEIWHRPLVVELLGTKIHRFYRAQIEFFGVCNGPGMAHFMANMILADAGGGPGPLASLMGTRGASVSVVNIGDKLKSFMSCRVIRLGALWVIWL